MRKGGFLACVLAITGASFVCAPANAGAATVIGDGYTISGGIGCGLEGTYIQTASPSSSYAAPHDGVITSWGSRGHFRTMTLKIARLGAGSQFTMIGSDGPRLHAENSELETYPVRIPVRQGDVIGMYVPAGTFNYCLSGGTDFTDGHRSVNVPPGDTTSFDDTESLKLPIEATIEHDGDGDGFGDETQDGCPTNASTQGACPLPTVLGQTFTPFAGVQSCAARTRVVTASPGTVSTAPADGVITSWSHLAQDDVGTGVIKLKLFRPLGGADYRVIGESASQKPTPSTLNTYGTRVPVREGDKIGLAVSDGVVPCSRFTAPGGYGIADGDVAVGASATFGDNSGALDISAVLEADADADGFGDASQDLCPTDATTQGQCRSAEPPVVIVPPDDDPACDKARKKLKKAKAKLAKLKEDDAKAKKIETGKKKVKKAKKAVKKAC